eukprot:TRINITY_DN1543_c0_g1_i1.p1 TRINITY_DN1543_c0_g1~~TRINITY_DN1543_c0_g1_i1.p1  ORF type:complete len:182 (+),score=2.62 TRINITY_DN1543_c0_g1_i1:144-689(+)
MTSLSFCPSVVVLKDTKNLVLTPQGSRSLSALRLRQKTTLSSHVWGNSLRLPQSLQAAARRTNHFHWTATWLDSSARVLVDTPLADAFDLWLDRERIPQWMPWISSVKVLPDKPELSRWTLKAEAFGQPFEFSWLAKNLQPIHHQKIHWRAMDGLPNRGAVRFFPKGPSSCTIEVIAVNRP